jgi:hypothetical protein
MPIYQTAHYQVHAAAVDKVTAAIEQFVRYVEQLVGGPVVFTDYLHVATNRDVES